MDLNYLFHRQQVERSKASSADSDAARKSHEELAELYENEIRRVSDGKVSFSAHENTDPGDGLAPLPG